MAQRLVVFADSRSFISTALVEATIEACEGRSDIALVAICDTALSPPSRRFSALRLVAKAAIKRLFDKAHPIVLHPPMWRTFRARARRAGIPLITPDERDVNHPKFISRIRRNIRPDLALSLICMQIFGEELLSSFAAAVNYHNGLLPAHRGVRATGWSVYSADRRTGFTFHHMTPDIDAGPVLHSDAVAVRLGESVWRLEWQKTKLAAAAIPLVLNAMAGGEAGSPQTGPAGYHSKRDCDSIMTIRDPATVTWDDLTRRLRAFGAIDMTLSGVPRRVTRVKPGRGARASLTFRTADGKTGHPTRLNYLPLPLHQIYRRLRR